MSTGRRLLSSTQVSRLLGVSPASVKRLADEGRLLCSRTMGGHRRFDRGVVERFNQAKLTQGVQVNGWADRFLSAHGTAGVLGVLMEERSRAGSWWPVALSLCAVDAELTRRSMTREIGQVERLVAGERLLRTIEQCNATGTLRIHPGMVLLVRPEFDHVRLRLALVELCAGDLGLATQVVGPVSVDALGEYLERGTTSAVVLAAGLRSDASLVEAYAIDVAAVCERLGVPCLFTGEVGATLAQLESLRSWLLAIAARPAAPVPPF